MGKAAALGGTEIVSGFHEVFKRDDNNFISRRGHRGL